MAEPLNPHCLSHGLHTSEPHLEEQFARVIVGLMQARRTLDPSSLAALLEAILSEIQIGLDVAEELVQEEFYRRPAGTDVIRFRGTLASGIGSERNGQE